jgi:type 1 glutamine amidotransferase
LLGDPKPPHNLPGLAEALDTADLLVVSIRRRSLPAPDLDAVRKFIGAGKPVVGIRTASHAFDAKGPLAEGRAVWPTFDADVLGGHYSGHYGLGPKTTVASARGAASHSILNGVQMPLVTQGSLYKVSPLATTTTTLLVGSIPGQAPEPVAWINQSGQSRVFYTSLGAPEDFRRPDFRRLLSNGILWTLDQPIPAP